MKLMVLSERNKQSMLFHQFPDLEWLRRQSESNFSNRQAWNNISLPNSGWPSVILNVKTGAIFRDNIYGPLSLFSNMSGRSSVTVDGRTVSIPEDCFFLTNQSQAYTLAVEKGMRAETMNIHFGERWSEDIITSLLSGKNYFDEADRHSPFGFYNRLFRKDQIVLGIQHKLLMPELSTIAREELLASLIVYLVNTQLEVKRQSTKLASIKASTRDEIVRRLHLASDYIHSNLEKNLTIEELSKVSAMSRFHFLRSFKDVFGCAPHQYLNKTRLDRATDLLKRPGLSIAEIGRAVGFPSASSFTRIFTRETGQNPSHLRFQS